MQIQEIQTHKYKLPSESERAKAKEKMEKMRKDGEKLIKGMFEFLDAQGGWLDFSYRFFPGEPCRTVRINHGEIVDLPMILVKHLNNIWKKVRTPNREMTEDGRFKGYAYVEKISRTRFTPMDVM
jgi:regulatory protein YycH of two-component signal transduction system YycFG